VRVETTRSAGVVKLRHGVGFTASDADVVAQAAPLVAAAMEKGCLFKVECLFPYLLDLSFDV